MDPHTPPLPAPDSEKISNTDELFAAVSKSRRNARRFQNKSSGAGQKSALAERPATPGLFRRPDIWISLALFAATLLVYAQAAHFAFLNYDDPDYVTRNSHLHQGITPDSIAWALTSHEAANWLPVTRLSHLLDWQLFGGDSGAHHLVNVLLHAFAALLLFAFLQRATKARWPSAFVAFLFALHPLHVESVAWISERKDVLSALFCFAALWAYARYTERPGQSRYALVAVAFALGLMAKPMLVTLPFVFVLLDIWPLHRTPLRRYVAEKIPFFVLSAVAATVTYVVQHQSGAVKALGAFPLGLRIENALVACLTYIEKFFWPARLAVFYPFPSHIPLWQPVAALAIIGAISLVAIRSLRTYPFIAVGWFWFLGTLVPIIGLVQVGAQARADRYTYIPFVGLSIALAWSAAKLVRDRPRAASWIALAGAGACCCSAAVTVHQLQYWRNSETLFQHALNVTDRNYVAQHNLGNALLEQQDRIPEAISHFEAALAINPDSVEAHTDLGSAFASTGRFQEAVAEYRAALRIDPSSAITHNNLANALSRLPGRLPEAIAEYQTALRINPDLPEAHNNLGSAFYQLHRLPEAVSEFETALRLDPDYAKAHNNLGSAYSEMPGHLPDAIAEYQAALRLNPNYTEARNNLALATSRDPRQLPAAISRYQTALAADPTSAGLHYGLAVALSKMPGRLPEAISQYEAALRLNPDYAEAHNNLGAALASIPGRLPDAISHFEAAVRINPQYADAQYNLGAALAGVPGRAAEAVAHLEAAVRIKPDPEAEQMLARLRAIRP